MAQARFEFRLEALLTQRRQVERDHQIKVAGIQQQIQTQLSQIAETQTRISAENHTLSGRELTGRLDMQYIAHEKRYVGNLQVRIVLAMQRMVQLERALGMAKVELLEAARARKVLEKLRDKQWARWRAEQDRKEAAMMDEIGTQLALRQLTETVNGRMGESAR